MLFFGINLGHWRSMFIYLLILLSPFFNVFPFPPSTDKSLGDCHVYRRCAPNFPVRFPAQIMREMEMVRETEMAREMRGETEISYGDLEINNSPCVIR